MTPPAYQSIPLEQITSSRHQARKTFDGDSLKALADSMKAEGLIQPVTVRRAPSPYPLPSGRGPTAGIEPLAFSLQGEGGRRPDRPGDSFPMTPGQSLQEVGRDEGPFYELVSGERRFRAARLLGWTAIDAKVIETVSEGEAAAKGLIENLQREDLNPIEEAEGFAELNKLDPAYWTQAKITEIAGKTQGHISETLRLLKLSDKVKDNIRRRIITGGHAVELLRLPSQKLQDKVADQINKKDLGVHETRAVVNKLLAKAGGKAAPSNSHTADPKSSFKFSGKPMDAWVTFSGQYPIIGNWDDFVVNLKKAFDDWRIKGIKGGKKPKAAAVSSSPTALPPPSPRQSVSRPGHPSGGGAAPTLTPGEQSGRGPATSTPLDPGPRPAGMTTLSDEEEQIQAAIEDAKKMPKIGRLIP